MEQDLPTARQEIPYCVDHESKAAVVGCKTCYNFFCSDCVNKFRDQACSGQDSHVSTDISKVLRALKTELEDGSELDSMKEYLQGLEEHGKDIKSELENEKRRMDEIFREKLETVENYLNNIQVDLQKAADFNNEEFRNNGDSSALAYQKFSMRNKTLRRIQLKITGSSYAVEVYKEEEQQTSNQTSGATSKGKEMKEKFLKFVIEQNPSGHTVNFLQSPRLITVRQDDAEHIYKLKDAGLVKEANDSIRLSENQTVCAISKTGGVRIKRTEGHGLEHKFIIDVRGKQEDQEISEWWCSDVKCVCPMGEDWILFITCELIMFYSCLNISAFNKRREQPINWELVDLIPVSDTEFVVRDEKELHLLKFKADKVTVKKKWSKLIKSEASSGCYSELYDLILIIIPGGLNMFKRKKGDNLGVFPLAEFGTTMPKNLMMIDDTIIFEGDVGGIMKVLIYHLEDEKTEEKPEEDRGVRQTEKTSLLSRFSKSTANLQKLFTK